MHNEASKGQAGQRVSEGMQGGWSLQGGWGRVGGACRVGGAYQVGQALNSPRFKLLFIHMCPWPSHPLALPQGFGGRLNTIKMPHV